MIVVPFDFINTVTTLTCVDVPFEICNPTSCKALKDDVKNLIEEGDFKEASKDFQDAVLWLNLALHNFYEVNNKEIANLKQKE